VHSDESASTVSARRRSVQCTSRHASTVLTCTVRYKPPAYRPTEAQGRSVRAPLVAYAPGP